MTHVHEFLVSNNDFLKLRGTSGYFSDTNYLLHSRWRDTKVNLVFTLNLTGKQYRIINYPVSNESCGLSSKSSTKMSSLTLSLPVSLNHFRFDDECWPTGKPTCFWRERSQPWLSVPGNITSTSTILTDTQTCLITRTQVSVHNHGLACQKYPNIMECPNTDITT